ncbi:MAG: PilZ domain-containing protein [Methylococcales bacterium]|nr:PilZ domain-containing protein [Methylococcales bacterium]
MFQDRKEYRKNFTSSGQLFIAGELLNFSSYDVSVKGILVSIMPGSLLVEFSDFEELLKENNSAEIYVKDLMLTGETDIAWAKMDNGKIMLGLEFRDVIYNAEKLWRKRRYYRSKRKFSGYLIADDKRLNFQGINVSVDGLSLQLDQIDSTLKPGYVVKLMVNGLDVKGLGKIVWINTLADESCVLGLRYLTIE